MDQVQEHLKKLRTKLDNVPILQKAEETVKVPKEYLVLGGSVLFVVLVFFGIGAGSLCSIIGFIYPTFKSIQCIEKRLKGDDTQWLIYWIIYSMFSVLEIFIDFLIYWIPFYYAFKLAFLLWAMLPQTKGAKFLYDSFLKDFLKKNESKIDAALDSAKKQASSIMNDVASSSDIAKEATAAVTEAIETKKDT